MAEHDPLVFANGLSAKLATRSRHLCALLGAGAARACGLPDISALETSIAGALPEMQSQTFTRLLDGRNLEEVLTRLRRISALLGGTTQEVDGLTAAAAFELDGAICNRIVRELDLGPADLGPMRKFAAWVARADYHAPVEVFTLNYDLLTETALEDLRVSYFDGFVGTFRAAFRTDLVEAGANDPEAGLPAFFARLWKLHGSVSWQWTDKEVVRLGRPVQVGDTAAIFPSDMKYDESRRVPFVVLQDRLRRALAQPETLTLITGYSWNDAHLNEVIFDAARSRQRSEIIAFCRSSIPSVLADRAIETPNLQVVTGDEAILSGRRGPWVVRETPPSAVWDGSKLALREFGPLAAFLASSAPPQRDITIRLDELLADGGVSSA